MEGVTTPQAVIFDLGKVLVDFDYSIAARRIAARGQIVPEKVRDFIDHSPLLFRFETGQMSKEEFFEEVRLATRFEGDFAEFASFFADIFAPMEPMVQIHASLRRRGMPTYIFSNTNELAVGHIRRNFPFFSEFDGYILSYQHGAMKPDARLYEVVEQVSQHKGTELLYLDDRPENIAAGAARGWQVILQETAEKTKAAMQAMGLVDGTR
jgi:HAD superfamily hydrolase (TIGR01509 family)